MVIEIDGTKYATLADVSRDLDIARQTLWRWRKAGKIPAGLRYRGYQVVFTSQEVAAIREFAYRLEPAEPGRPSHRLKGLQGKVGKAGRIKSRRRL